MRFNAFLIACLMAAVSTAPVSAQGLKRLTLRQDLLGWEAVGRVELPGASFCTGVLISPEFVLTAAHCVLNSRNGRRTDPSKIRFRAGLRDGTAIAESSVSQIAAPPEYSTQSPNDENRLRHDVALLKLSDPISSGTASPFRVDLPSEASRNISVVSYARGRASALSRERTCNVIGHRRGLLAFDCDVYFGSSGAPVFDLSSGQARVVSIISSGTRTDDRTISFGMELPSLVSDLKRAFRTGRGVWPQIESQGARRVTTGTARTAGGARFLKP